MKLREKPFRAMKDGKKDIELRLYDKKRKALGVGDYIAFSHAETGEVLYALVKELHRAPDFRTLYAAFPKERLGYGEEEIASYMDMEAYYSIEEQNEKSVVGIEIALQSAPCETVDIHSRGDYPANALSNFYPHSFTLDGVFCASMEGFLQGLKYKDPQEQKRVCSLAGKEAKAAGKGKWLFKITGNLFWQGKRIRRRKREYFYLVSRAYETLLEENPAFRHALLCTQHRTLRHTVGKRSPFFTVLTEKELIAHLYALRGKIDKEGF